MDIPFLDYHHSRLQGKIYKTTDKSKSMILAYEKKTTIGKKDLAEAQEHLSSSVEGGTLGKPVELKP